MDRILIRELRAECTIGVDKRERRVKQEVVISAALSTDTSIAGRSDKLEDTVDYGSIKIRILEVAASAKCSLIEALAERIADACLDHPRVTAVEVTIEKPSAAAPAAGVGVQITRTKDDRPTQGRAGLRPK
jgi:dihydroneopterin aldolase